MKELTIEAKIDNLCKALDFISAELEMNGCKPKLLAQISIATEEIFVNISSYAYRPEIGGVSIRIKVNDMVTIEFEDNGTPYNPLIKNDPDVHLSAEEREVGGLGIFMVKKIMDTIEYQHIDNKNILIIKKVLV